MQALDGIENLIKVRYAAILFGSARLPPESPYYQAAEKRFAGFGLTFLPSVILLLGGLVGGTYSMGAV